MNYGALLQQTDLRKIYFSVGLGVWIRSPAEGQQNKSYCKGCKSRSFFQPNTMSLTTKPSADMMLGVSLQRRPHAKSLLLAARRLVTQQSSLAVCSAASSVHACTEWGRTRLLSGFSSHQNYQEGRERQAVSIYALPHPQRNNNNNKKTDNCICKVYLEVLPFFCLSQSIPSILHWRYLKEKAVMSSEDGTHAVPTARATLSEATKSS